MIIHNIENINNLPEGEVHLAIGTFDGIHLGHQQIIKAAIKKAQESNGISVVLTFWPHPSTFFNPNFPTPTIMPADIKNRFLEEMGVDIIIQQKFTPEFAHTTPENFIKLLKTTFPNLKAIYTGTDFHFGHNREGDVNFLERTGQYEGFTVIKQKDVLYEGKKISSTRIRKALQEGKMEEANAMLGYTYFSIGLIMPPFPPLTITWRPELKPKYGTYAIQIQSGNKAKKFETTATYSIPSDNKDPTIEIHLRDPTEFETTDPLRVEWLKFLGPP